MEPIYQRVKKAVSPEGRIPETLVLELEPGSTDGEEMSRGPLAGKRARYANGEWDCEILYEYNYVEKKEKARLEQLKELTQFAAGEGAYEEKARQLTACLTPHGEGEMILCLRELSKWLESWLDEWPDAQWEGEREGMDPLRLFAFADRLLVESANIESVKYALTVLAQKDDMPPEQRDQVRTLALCGEFTHYCIPAVLKWEKGMEELFQIARKSKGAGRTMAVRVLMPSTREMRDWLLDEGWCGGWHCSYNAARCANRGRLQERLEGPVTPEQLERATELIHTLLDDTTYVEQPDWKQIGWVKNADRLLLAWMNRLEDWEPDFRLVKLVSTVIDLAAEHAKRGSEGWAKVEDRARELLLAPRGRAAVEKVMWEGQDFAVGRKLGLNWQEPLLACAERETGRWHSHYFGPSVGSVHGIYDYYYELELLFKTGEPWTSRVLELWERRLMEELHSHDYLLEPDVTERRRRSSLNTYYQPLLEVVKELEPHPGRGLSLVLTLLEVPTPNCRRTAMQVLRSWQKQGWAWTAEVDETIARLLENETDEQLRNQLEGTIYFRITEVYDRHQPLPRDFSLEPGVVDGERDGLAVLQGEALSEELLEPLLEVSRLAAGGNKKEANARLRACLQGDGRVLGCADGLRTWVGAHPEGREKLFDYAKGLLTGSRQGEAVKYALTVLAEMEEMPKEIRNPVRVLARCNEFTLFCIPIIRRWDEEHWAQGVLGGGENEGKELFATARVVEGWGRIHLVRALEPLDEATKELLLQRKAGCSRDSLDAVDSCMGEWILNHGWDNTVRPAWSALDCARKGRLLEALRRECHYMHMEGVNGLIRALLDEGVCPNISVMEDAEALLLAYLDREQYDYTEEEAATARAIWEAAGPDRLNLPQVRKLARGRLNKLEPWLERASLYESIARLKEKGVVVNTYGGSGDPYDPDDGVLGELMEYIYVWHSRYRPDWLEALYQVLNWQYQTFYEGADSYYENVYGSSPRALQEETADYLECGYSEIAAQYRRGMDPAAPGAYKEISQWMGDSQEAVWQFCLDTLEGHRYDWRVLEKRDDDV